MPTTMPRALSSEKIDKMMVTYRAYCITPFLPSWLASGTSRFTFPVTLTGALASYVDGTALAGLEDDVEIAATLRNGIKAVLGLAVERKCQISCL